MVLCEKKVAVGDPQQMLAGHIKSVPPAQWLRELVQNTFDAGASEVLVDTFTGACGAQKLRISDDGVGMSPAELEDRLGTLHASDRTGVNHGIGAKISLARHVSRWRYVSMHDGVVSVGIFGQDSVGDWGWLLLPRPATDSETLLVPNFVTAAGHGTVVLLDGSAAQDTVELFSGTIPGSDKGHWAALGINARYVDLPQRTKVSYRMPRQMSARQVYSRRSYLNTYSGTGFSGAAGDGASGQLVVEAENGATAQVLWWLLDSAPKPSTYARFARIGASVSVAYGSELYPESAAQMLRTAGVWTVASRVELVIVPDAPVSTNLERTMVVDAATAQRLPVNEWLSDFRKKMPEEVASAVEAASARSRRSASNTLLERYQQFFPLKNPGVVSAGPLRGTLSGMSSASPAPSPAKKKEGKQRAATEGTPRKRDGRRSSAGVVRKVREKRPTSPRRATASGLLSAGTAPVRQVVTGYQQPQVVWTDDACASAASWDPVTNTIIASTADVGYRMMVTALTQSLTNAPGVHTKAEVMLQDALAETLTSPVLGAQAAGRSDLITDESLSVVLLDLLGVAEKVATRVRRSM